jgi:hypothetical protein
MAGIRTGKCPVPEMTHCFQCPSSMTPLCAFIGRVWLAPPFLLLPAVVMAFVGMEALLRGSNDIGRDKDALISTLAKKQ